MFTIRPEDQTEAQAETIEAHWTAIADVTPESRLERHWRSEIVDDPDGLGVRFRRPKSVSGTYWVLVPSDSQIGLWWELRVSWRDGYVQAGHYGRACPAADAGRLCWHVFAAARKIAALHYGGEIPVSAVPLRATPDPRPRAQTTVSEPERVPWPVDHRFYA